MADTDLKPGAIAAGLLVVGAVLVFSSRSKRRCTKLPDIHHEAGPLHLTRESQDEATELARYKIREYILAGEIYKLSDVQMYVADELRDCSWENLETAEQKEAKSGEFSPYFRAPRRRPFHVLRCFRHSVLAPRS